MQRVILQHFDLLHSASNPISPLVPQDGKSPIKK